MTRTTFIVRTAAGRAICTFEDGSRAARFAREHRLDFPGLYVESETTSVLTRRLWTDRQSGSLRLVAGGVR